MVGSPDAWRFVIEYPLMDTQTRIKQLQPGLASTALLLAQVLDVAETYQIQVLLDEWEIFRSSWTRLTSCTEPFTEDGELSPETPAWWIDLASKHPYDSYKVAGPAICALLRMSTYQVNLSKCGSSVRGVWYVAVDKQWGELRTAHLTYGRKQGGALWGLVCQLLEGCSR